MSDQGFGEPADQLYLSEVSPKDKPWDTHRAEAEIIKDLYDIAEYKCLADRIDACSRLLGYGWNLDPNTGELRPKLKSARCCRCRHCAVCQWRRKLMWTARMMKALPIIFADHPTAKYIHLVLTVENCELSDLRSTLDWMNQSWKRMTQRKTWPAIGFARATEVTRSKDGRAHPHFHALLMVPGGYFSGRDYMNKAEWVQSWQDCLKVNYGPSISVRKVKSKKDCEDALAGLQAAVLEVFKYQVKPEDLIGKGEPVDAEWLALLTQQLDKTRAISFGGVLRKYISEDEPEDLIGKDESGEELEGTAYFGWREKVKRYAKNA
jgi:plasmid rolling circle replication initiator protein Rep